MRNRYDEQLMLLNKEMIEIGAMCEEAIEFVSKALIEKKYAIVDSVEPLVKQINEMAGTIESHCMKLLLQQQPVAKDLRQISAALRMVTDMKRIGDQAEDIAEIIGYLDEDQEDDYNNIRLMASATIKMVTESVDAFVKKDVDLAEATIVHDDIVDEYFIKVKQALIKMIAEDSTQGECALDLLMIAKYFERIGDHAANIAKWVVYFVIGEQKGD